MPGNYQLIATDTLVGCEAKSPLIKINNLAGPSLITGDLKITAASCGGSNGSIKSIKAENVTGTPILKWEDESGAVVSNKMDLLNVPGGTYRLTFKDESSCDAIVTEYYTVGGSSKITINAAQAAITPSQCRYGSGSIKGVTVSGAADYIWTNEKGAVVSTELNATALLPGTYTLTAGTATGCPKTSPAIGVPVNPDMQLDLTLQTTITPATCAKPNGSVVLQNFPTGTYSFTWKGPDGVSVGTAKDLKNVSGGTYTLYATDAVGCTQRATTSTIAAIAPPQLQPGVVKNDVCTQLKGSIKNSSVTNGTAPFTYTWLNQQQQTVGTSSNLLNVGAGAYQLQVQDASGCTVQSSYTIANETKSIITPHYPAQLIPRHTNTTLMPQNSQAGTWEWFADATLTQMLDANSTGVFQTPNLPDDKTYYIRLREGTCSSGTAAVVIKVADDAQVYVPTAFTPNRDGKNDDIRPLVTGIFKLDYFTIYDRWGRVVFKTSDLAKGWNGYNKGLEAPLGAYVWLLKGMDYKGRMIQQKGTVTLIR
jgi:gliding motility-associated-like protein